MSPNTIKALLSDLRHFKKWYEAANGETLQLERILPMDVIDYKNCYISIHKPSTINRRLASLKMLFKVAQEEQSDLKDPTMKVKSLSLQPLAPRSLTEQDTRKLLKELELRGSLRDKVIVYLMLYAGLRASEVLALRLEDVEISPKKGLVHIRSSKGNKSRVVPLCLKIRGILSEFIDSIDGPQLLYGQRGPLKSTITINKIVEKYANHAQVECSPHCLRHTFAYRYLQHNTGDLVGLAQLMGHSNIQTTSEYVMNRLEDLEIKLI